jgi:hypothetical protein
MNLINKLKTLSFFLKPKKVVAMYKLYFGDEWLECSVDSIVRKMYKIVFLISDIPWGDNTNIEGDDLQPIIDRLNKKYPGKIVIHRGSWNRQLEHVKAGMRFVKEKFPEASHLLYVDSDEVYPSPELDKLLRLMHEWPYFNRVIRVQYNTYFKTIYYRITPRSWPTAGALIPLRDFTDFIDARNVFTVNSVDVPYIFYEHFAYVRKNDERIRQKIEAHRETEPIIGDWFNDVWMKWSPQMNDFHPTNPHFWKTVETVSRKELSDDIVATFESWKNELANPTQS